MAEYIEREAAIAVIEEKQKELCPVGMYSRHAVYGSDREKYDAWQEIIDALEATPAADVRPVRRGKWLDMGDFISCSSCNATRLKEFESDYGKVMRLDARTNFCPNCGADMREES